MGRPFAQGVQQRGNLNGIQPGAHRAVFEQPMDNALHGVSACVASRVLRESAHELRGLSVAHRLQVPRLQGLPGDPVQRLHAGAAVRELAELARRIRIRGSGRTFEPRGVQQVMRTQFGTCTNPAAQGRFDPAMFAIAQFGEIVAQQGEVRVAVASRKEEYQRPSMAVAFGQDIVAGHVDASRRKVDAALVPELVLLLAALVFESRAPFAGKVVFTIVQRSRQRFAGRRRRYPSRPRRAPRRTRQVLRSGTRRARGLRSGRSRGMAPCRVTDMSGREVAVGAIELHGLRMRCNNGNVRASRAWVCEGMSRGAAGEGPCNVRKWAAGGVRACGQSGWLAIHAPLSRAWRADGRCACHPMAQSKKIPVRRVGIAQGGHRRIAVADGSGCTHLT